MNENNIEAQSNTNEAQAIDTNFGPNSKGGGVALCYINFHRKVNNISMYSIRKK